MKGDSLLVAGWCNGIMRCKSPALQSRVANIQRHFHEDYCTGQVRTGQVGGDWVRHVFRQTNRISDERANRTMDRRADAMRGSPLVNIPCAGRHLRLRASFDGGRRSSRAAAAAYVMEIWDSNCWRVWRRVGRWLPGATAAMAGVVALEMLSSLYCC